MDNKRPKYQWFLFIIIGIFLLCLASPNHSPAGPAIPGFYGSGPSLPTVASGQLPVLNEVIQGLTPADIVETTDENRLDVYQQESKAIIDWHSFDIGSDARTRFHQQQEWVALNRIYSASPTRIYGTLDADGTVYLINTNGILFGPGSRINVHSLAASSLGIDQAEFLGGILHFSGNDLNGPVSNHGEINADTGGWVFLAAPRVENGGTINAPEGQVGLIAGNDAEITILEAEQRVFPFIYVQPGSDGTAVNFEGGSLTADEGLVGLYGRVVQQEGLIRAVTATRNRGRIELHASEKVTTGAASITESPVSDDPESVHKSFSAGGGEIHIGGLDYTLEVAGKTVNRTSSTGRIEHRGRIAAPSGRVDLPARERVYLEKESVIDVSGEWAERSAESNIVTLQLNSMELKNDYGQKWGILQGEYISLDPYEGSSIGDASGALNYEEFTAREMNTEGGRINIQALEGDIILRQGSLIDFSGGGTRFSGGFVKTTALLGKDGNLYTVSDAPEWMTYEKIMETGRYVEAHKQGDDAGYLTLESRGLVMDGGLDGSATRGMYQRDPTLSETAYGTFAVLNTRGTREPRGGSLILGEDSPFATATKFSDHILDEVVLTKAAPILPEEFGPEDDLKSVRTNGDTPYASLYSDQAGPLYRSILSADTINAAGLSDLTIHTNTKFTTHSDVGLSLIPGGYRVNESIEYGQNHPLQYLDDSPATFTVKARAIEHRGDIVAPSGDVIFELTDTITTENGLAGPEVQARWVEMDEQTEQILLEEGSRLSVAGDRIDNSSAGSLSPFEFGHTAGGDLVITNASSGGGEVILRSGADLDVSGGYEITPEGEVEGGDAGSLTITGPGLVLEGSLKGLAVHKSRGGELTLHAGSVRVAAEPGESTTGLVVHPDLLDQTGFTRIALLSQGDLTFEEGALLRPSYTKMVPDTRDGNGGLIEVAPEHAGETSISATAGVALPGNEDPDPLVDTQTLTVQAGSRIQVAPGGRIDLSGLIVDIGGRLHAPAGDIFLEATGVNRALSLDNGSLVSVAGLNVMSGPPLMQGLPPTYDSLSAGTVQLYAKKGEVIVEQGAVVDVSGPAPVREYYFDSGFNLQQRTVAGHAGELDIQYETNLVLEGDLRAGARTPSARGGALSMTKYSELEGMTAGGQDLEGYAAAGFDALALRSLAGISLEGPMEVEFTDSLTLDAPSINALDSEEISLSAASILLANSLSKYPDERSSYLHLVTDDQPLNTGDATLTLSGQWVDVKGGIALTGFEDVTISAAGDMRLSDEKYLNNAGMEMWKGQLRTPGNMTLEAARIYPTTRSAFTLAADEGRIRIQSSGQAGDGPILSAGGSLTIAAGEILQGGYVAAPMGDIRFVKDKVLETAADRIYFSKESITTTEGEAPVAYGTLDDGFWTVRDKPQTLTLSREVQTRLVEAVPEKEIGIFGDEIIVREGALINASGGGSIFGYEFQAGIDGLVNPFAVKGRSVVIPGTALAGEGVYLEGAGGLPAGEYTLLPEEYAFMPGAFVIEDLGPMDAVGQASQEGYALCTGYGVEMGTGHVSSEVRGYSIRPAKDLLGEGHFNVSELTAGQGGNVTIQGLTTIVDGTVQGFALEGFSGGRFSVSGSRSAVVTTAASLPEDFGFETPMPTDLQDTAIIRSAGLSARGFEELEIGTLDLPGSTVVMEQGAQLESPVITLYAGKIGPDAIVLEQDAAIHATGEGGTAGLIAPDGGITIESGAMVRAEDTVNLNAEEMDLDGVIETPSLNIVSKSIGIVPNGYTEKEGGVFYLAEDLEGIVELLNLGLKASSEITVAGDLNMDIEKSLTMDGPLVRGIEYEGLMDARIRAQSIHLLNSGDGSSGSILSDTGVITLADDNMRIGHGSVLFDGFDAVNLESLNDLIISGKGSLITGGDLNITAARLALSHYADSENNYEVPRFLFQAGDEDLGYRDISLKKSNGLAGEGVIPGGSLSMLGRSIEISSLVQTPSANLLFEAMGANAEGVGINLTEDGEILAKGGEDSPGGRVELRAGAGELRMARGSLIDVSAGTQGDAGSIILYAPEKGVALDGEIRGEARGGTGGSFFMDTDDLSIGNGINRFSSMNRLVGTGGFDEEVEIRVRGGNVTIAEEDRVTARRFSLAADDGGIRLNGTIDASGEDAGGSVQLSARSLVRVEGTIDASGRGDGSSGGDVSLAASEGYVELLPDSLVDVSGGSGGLKGTVHLRATRYEDGAQNEVNVTPRGTIRGASRITTEAVRIYQDDLITTPDINTWRMDTQTFMDNYAAAIKTRLASDLTMEDCDAGALHLVPGIEIQSGNDLRLASAWDTTSWRYGDEAGVLTLRSGGDLLVNEKIVDHPTYLTMLNDQLQNPPDSWGINLVAGADLSGADILATVPGTGDMTIAAQKLVYTENAPVRFAAGGDVMIHSPPRHFMDKYMVNPSMGYSLATYSGDISGKVGGDLTILDGGAIQSATGHIDITVGGDLDLDLNQITGSAIRTTGTAPPDRMMGNFNWRCDQAHDGGDISLDVAGAVRVDEIPFSMDYGGTPHLKFWDNIYQYQDADGIHRIWSADFGFPTNPNASIAAGLVTMGGGDLTVHSGGDFYCQAGTFSQGDLNIHANGDISGYFQVAEGKGGIHALGSLKNVDPDVYENSLAIFHAQVDVHAEGDLEFGTIFNPTYTDTYAEYNGLTLSNRYLDYGMDSSVKLTAVQGDLSLSGAFWKEGYLDLSKRTSYRVLPPNVEMTAGNDILLGSESGGYFVLAPSPNGNLVMTAGGDIDGYHEVQGIARRSTLRLSDYDPEDVYRIDYLSLDLFADETQETSHASSGPIHQNDPDPVQIVAGGDIRELELIMPKQTEVSAGNDIRGLYYFGQNVHPTDISYIRANGDILLTSDTDPILPKTGLIHGGPGFFMVQTGHAMDLGISQGIQTVGNAFFPILQEENSALAVVAGLSRDLPPEEIEEFFTQLLERGLEYSRLQADGNLTGAKEVIQKTEEEIIEPFFDEEMIPDEEAAFDNAFTSLLPEGVYHLADMDDAGRGDILMTDARINTMAESSDAYIISRGTMDVGLSTLPDLGEAAVIGDQRQSGIFTTKGGDINIFALCDINVNESRVMTFRGGDILLWSHEGNINAGRGSKTAINAGSPRTVWNDKNENGEKDPGEITIEWEPPSVGSGIRTVTYDLEIFPGDAYLFAPQGVIDAGEAGIAARNLVLGATEVVNAQNISFSQGGLGVPTNSGGGTNIGSLAGSGALAEASELSEDSSGLGSAKERMERAFASMADNFVTQWLDVKVIEFEESEDEDEDG